MTSTTHRVARGSAKQAVSRTSVVADDTASTPHRWLAVIRVGLGFVFLWAFLDKLFGLGYATPAARAWINGGSPTSGYLGNVDAGPFRGAFQGMAGVPVLDWLFMIGLLGIGLALILGIGMRIAAATGTLMLILMYLADWPLATLTAGGEPTGSNNPLIDSHLVYAAVLVVLAITAAGCTWGLGKWWQSTRAVKRFTWLR